ncbi:MAG: ASKHA domain-containing protein [Planctomycetia bacterium]|nr:ASKHA domain-containing protein [Planctomycetia bacterium]
MYRITFPQFHRTVTASPGERLSDIIQKFLPNSWEWPCGGKGICGKCRVKIRWKKTSQPENVLACQTFLHSCAQVWLPKKGIRPRRTKILSRYYPAPEILAHSEETAKTYAVAVDVGTTTLVASLAEWSSRGGKLLATTCRPNPQAVHGADVLSRIDFAMRNQDGTRRLREMLLKTLREMFQEIGSRKGISPADLKRLCVAGNTTMEEIFLGISPESLGTYPFLPSPRLKSRYTQADFPEKEIFVALGLAPDAEIFVFPVIGGFVGGDITAGILFTEAVFPSFSTTLLLDIGTNGEMVLTQSGKRIACATAAGPALEGGTISCGMRAETGAISAVRRKGDSWQFRTLRKGKPIGICGSGLIDLTAELLRSGELTSDGRLLHTTSIALTPNVVVTQNDLRQLQLAAGAIRAGIQILWQKQRLSPDALEKVYVAGGFGKSLNIRNAQRIGLLPAEIPAEKFLFLGNTSLAGAVMGSGSALRRNQAAQLASQTEYLDLSQEPTFTETFMDCMMWPEGTLEKGGHS